MRWRTILAGIVFMLTINAVAAYGIFARASDVKQVREGQLDIWIWETHKQRCVADEGSGLREALAKRVNDLLKEYRETTGTEYKLPDCKEFKT